MIDLFQVYTTEGLLKLVSFDTRWCVTETSGRPDYEKFAVRDGKDNRIFYVSDVNEAQERIQEILDKEAQA